MPRWVQATIFASSGGWTNSLTPPRLSIRIVICASSKPACPHSRNRLKQLWQDHKLAVDKIRDMEKQVAAAASPTPPSPSASPAAGAPSVAMADAGKLRQQPVREVEIATWIRAVYSRKQLQEVLVDFWHNHFNVYGWDDVIAPVFAQYDRDVIRAHALGNFREMIEAVAKSPAMLFYLDNGVNQSGNPNENFARELFELHTLGAESYLGTGDRTRVKGFASGKPVGYVDGDVYESARAFTGWRVDSGGNSGETGEFVYYDGWHDRFQKVVLGHSLKEYGPPMSDGHAVLDAVAFHAGTARHVCRKLCVRLIGDQPPESIVAASAQVFQDKRQAHDQIAQVVRFIVRSPEFRQALPEKFKRPFEMVASLLRVTEAEFFPSEQFQKEFQRTGQRLFQWRTPDGYPDTHEKWGGASSMLERWRICNLLVQGKVEGTHIVLRSVAGDSSIPSVIALDWTRRLLGSSNDPDAHAAISGLLAQGRDLSAPLPENLVQERLPGAVALILMSPEFQRR